MCVGGGGEQMIFVVNGCQAVVVLVGVCTTHVPVVMASPAKLDYNHHRLNA